ncbi:MAG: type II toxin-antitoxin system RelE/ParE family toxin [Chlamydiia bacterium]|nr:type II toxin-antitoxin system RelE/ParE family toxin [Chlamydiia bacterium]
MKYKIQLKRSVIKALKSFPKRDLKKVAKKIDSLEQDPIPKDSKKIKGEEDLYRVRVGDYRILYFLQRSVLTILVIRVAHRKDVYNDL